MNINSRFLVIIYFLSLALVNRPIIGIGADWNQIGQDIHGEVYGDFSGIVSLSGDGTVVAIGAHENDGIGFNSGHVRVYQKAGGAWSQIGQDIDGETAGDLSGFSVSLSDDGSILAIGATANDGNDTNSGHVRVYQNAGGTWNQIGQDIDGEAADNWSGASVSLSGDGSALAIGAPGNNENGDYSGHVRVYQYIDSTWSQIGQDIDGETAGDNSGAAVSINGDGSILAIGAPLNSDIGIYAGHVRVYQNIDGIWNQIGQDIDGEAAGDQSGDSVSLSDDGTVVAIGALGNDGNGLDAAGHVRVYQNIDGTWNQIGQDIDGETAGDYSGAAVSLSDDGSILAIGAAANDGNGTNSGHARVYKNAGGIWSQVGQDIDGEAAYDCSGESISLSGDGAIVAIGARYNDDGFVPTTGHVRVFTSNNVYTFPWPMFLPAMTTNIQP